MKIILSITILLMTMIVSADENPALREHRIQIAKEDLAIIKKSIVMYKLKRGSFPKTLKDMKIKKKDPWGNDYFYKPKADGFFKYHLYSFGPDHVKSEDDIDHRDK